MKKLTSSKTKIAFWLLLLGFAYVILCAFLAFTGAIIYMTLIDVIYVPAVFVSTIFEFIATMMLLCSPFVLSGLNSISIVLQIWALRSGESKTKNTLMMLFTITWEAAIIFATMQFIKLLASA